jgi:hypothetical protein
VEQDAPTTHDDAPAAAETIRRKDCLYFLALLALMLLTAILADSTHALARAASNSPPAVLFAAQPADPGGRPAETFTIIAPVPDRCAMSDLNSGRTSNNTLAANPSGESEKSSRQCQLDLLLEAIRMVESVGNDNAVGDGGKAFGPYQISWRHWRDAMRQGGVYWSYPYYAYSRSHARQAVLWYWERFCPEALDRLDFETLARVHNGGPDGMGNRRTLGYWRRVREQLDVLHAGGTILATSSQ